MDFSTALSPELQTFLTGVAGGTLANLGADFTTRLLGAAKRARHDAAYGALLRLADAPEERRVVAVALPN